MTPHVWKLKLMKYLGEAHCEGCGYKFLVEIETKPEELNQESIKRNVIQDCEEQIVKKILAQ